MGTARDDIALQLVHRRLRHPDLKDAKTLLDELNAQLFLSRSRCIVMTQKHAK
jgi:hypothetical protein